MTHVRDTKRNYLQSSHKSFDAPMDYMDILPTFILVTGLTDMIQNHTHSKKTQNCYCITTRYPSLLTTVSHYGLKINANLKPAIRFSITVAHSALFSVTATRKIPIIP